MPAPVLHARSIAPRVAELLEDSPVVLIHGPRQCGKTTLAQIVCAPKSPGSGGNPPAWPTESLGRGSRAVAGVEVKAAATVTGKDFRGLRKLARAAGERFVRGVVLYDGEACVPFGPGLYAGPVRRLWEGF